MCALSRLNMGQHPNLACPFFFFYNQENELSGSDKETCLTRAAMVPWKRLFMNMYSNLGSGGGLIFQTFLFPFTDRISSHTRPVIPFKEYCAVVCPCVFVSSPCICVPSPV